MNLSLSARLWSHLHGYQRALYFEGSLNKLHRKDDYRLVDQLSARLWGEQGAREIKINGSINSFSGAYTTDIFGSGNVCCRCGNSSLSAGCPPVMRTQLPRAGLTLHVNYTSQVKSLTFVVRRCNHEAAVHNIYDLSAKLGRTWFCWRRIGAKPLGCNGPRACSKSPAGFLFTEGGLSKTKSLGTTIAKQSVCS